MPDVFDPYHDWLGIPAKDQPPNHYRLLGVELFEAKVKVIEAAADRQMAHLRTYQTGAHSALSQRLLNEVAQAKIVLLQSGKRGPYDAQLRAALAQQSEAVSDLGGQTQAAPVFPAAAAAPSPAQPSLGLRSSARPAPRRPLWQHPAFPVGAVGIVTLLAMVAALWVSHSRSARQPEVLPLAQSDVADPTLPTAAPAPVAADEIPAPGAQAEMPAPAPAEPQPAPAEPQPAPAEPQPAPAEPQPAPAEPKTIESPRALAKAVASAPSPTVAHEEGRVGLGAVPGAAEDVLPQNLAPLATASATSERDRHYQARFAIDGKIAAAGSHHGDRDAAWCVSSPRSGDRADFTLSWKEPVTVSQIVYWGRTAWYLNECWKQYEVFADQNPKAIAKGEFRMLHGPQRIEIAETRLSRLTLKFLNSYGGPNPGAAEIQVFAIRPTDAQLAAIGRPQVVGSARDEPPAPAAAPLAPASPEKAKPAGVAEGTSNAQEKPASSADTASKTTKEASAKPGTSRGKRLAPKGRYEAMLGLYSNDKQPIPFINLSLPNGKNFDNDEIRAQMRGKVNLGELGYAGIAHFEILQEGTYEFDQNFFQVLINGIKTGMENKKGTVPMPKGVYELRLTQGTHGHPRLSYVRFQIRNTETGEQVPLFCFGSEIERYLAQHFGPFKPIEVSGWQPVEVPASK